jgi:hypothetical protein
MVQGGKQTGAYMAIEYPAGGVPTFVTKKFMVALAGTVKENSIGTPRVELDPGSLIQFVQRSVKSIGPLYTVTKLKVLFVAV